LLFQLATARFRREEYTSTLQILNVALHAITASRNVQKHIQFKNLEALSHMHLGETRQALDIYDRALILARESSETDEEARILFNIGNLLETNGTDECITYLEQAKKILKQSGNSVGLSFCSNTFASYYRNRGEPEKALGFSLDALKQITERGDPADIAEFLCNLALSEMDLGEHSSAQGHLEQALKIVDAGKERKFADKLVSLLALIHIWEEKIQEAEELLNSIQDTIEDSSVDARADYWKARYRCFKQKGQMKQALEAYEKAVELNQEQSEEKRQRMIDMAIEERQLQREKRERELLDETNLQLVRTNRELKESVEKVNALTELLPVCCSCRRVRDDEGYWKQLREFMVDHSDVQFSECLCAECAGEISSPSKEVDE
jgi:tetratricopeptide (TPR) repeat protein